MEWDRCWKGPCGEDSRAVMAYALARSRCLPVPRSAPTISAVTSDSDALATRRGPGCPRQAQPAAGGNATGRSSGSKD